MGKHEPALLILSRGKRFLILFWFLAIFAFVLIASSGFDIDALGPAKIISFCLAAALTLCLYMIIFMAIGIVFTDDEYRIRDYLLLVAWPLSAIWACHIYHNQNNLYE